VSQVTASEPLIATAVVTLIVSPALDSIIRATIRREFADPNDPSPIPMGRRSSDIADAVSWSIDQYTMLLLALVTPFTGLLLLLGNSEQHPAVVGFSYFISTALILVMYAAVHRRQPSGYVTDCRAGSIPVIGGLLSKFPIIKEASWAMLFNTLVLGLAAAVTAYATK